MKKILALLVALMLPAVAMAEQPGRVEVKIEKFMFGPEKLTVPVGTTVVWTNKDIEPHTVVSKDQKLFVSEALDTNETFSYTFDKPGTFDYFCSVHPYMVASVTVTPKK